MAMRERLVTLPMTETLQESQARWKLGIPQPTYSYMQCWDDDEPEPVDAGYRKFKDIKGEK